MCGGCGLFSLYLLFGVTVRCGSLVFDCDNPAVEGAALFYSLLCGLTVVQPFLVTVVRVDSGAAFSL